MFFNCFSWTILYHDVALHTTLTKLSPSPQRHLHALQIVLKENAIWTKYKSLIHVLYRHHLDYDGSKCHFTEMEHIIKKPNCPTTVRFSDKSNMDKQTWKSYLWKKCWYLLVILVRRVAILLGYVLFTDIVYPHLPSGHSLINSDKTQNLHIKEYDDWFYQPWCWTN